MEGDKLTYETCECTGCVSRRIAFATYTVELGKLSDPTILGYVDLPDTKTVKGGTQPDPFWCPTAGVKLRGQCPICGVHTIEECKLQSIPTVKGCPGEER